MCEPVFYFKDDDPVMQQAYASAKQSFKYFWRELSWERRRIVPGLEQAMVKLPFTDGPRTDGNAEFEYMWVGELDFDGNTLTGGLLNAPNWLASVKQGDAVSVPFDWLADWMMTAEGKAYGAFTVNAMRSRMSAKERKAHDEAWGLDFGDPGASRIEIERGSGGKPGVFSKLFGGKSGAHQPGAFADHPMCVNMLPKIESQLAGDASIAASTDDRGWTLLHSEALAGNLGVVKLLVRRGADINALTPDGRDAITLARGVGWDEVADYLAGAGNQGQQ